jgi:cystathionine beta-lyase/cystathionine gamma-synthase
MIAIILNGKEPDMAGMTLIERRSWWRRLLAGYAAVAEAAETDDFTLLGRRLATMEKRLARLEASRALPAISAEGNAR